MIIKQIPPKRFHLKLLAATVSLMLPTLALHASDLEIYQPPAEGGGTVMLMLDTSGSMEEYDNKGCWIKRNGKIVPYSIIYSGDRRANTRYSDKFKVTVKTDELNDKGDPISGKTIGYTGRGCTYKGEYRFDRLTILKQTLINLLADPKNNIREDYIKFSIGLGSFYNNGYNNLGGIINAPATKLDYKGRLELIEKIANLKAGGATPSANAYAEAGAYMLGTTTNEKVEPKIQGYLRPRNPYSNQVFYDLYKCSRQSSKKVTFTDPRDNKFQAVGCQEYTKTPNNDLSSLGAIEFRMVGSPTKDYSVRNSYEWSTYYYFDNVSSTDAVDNPASGITHLEAPDKSKMTVGNNYKSPINESEKCKGYGIFFLTDGEPNGVLNKGATRLMNLSLSGSAEIGRKGVCSISDFGKDRKGQVVQGFVDAEGSWGASWACMAEYSQKLFKKENPKGVSIQTATVGFGRAFKNLANLKTTRPVRQPDGTYKDKEVYDCYSADTVDARNLCLLGEEGYDYGQGGFTYAENEKELGKSLVDFLGKTGAQYSKNISTGFMSVPVDELNTLQSRGVAYLPALEPTPGSTDLWSGNLKKYNIRNGTIVGADPKQLPVFKNKNGEFSENTWDKWNTIKDDIRPDTLKPDLGKPQVGGTYQHIFENKNQEATRNLFVDVGGELVNLQVTGTNGKFETSGFDKLGIAKQADDAINVIKIQLLGFMGYNQLESGFIVEDKKPFSAKFDKLNKGMGGVIHSLPKLITSEIKLKEGRFDNSTRQDYVLYGSMDGVLHLVEDSSGKELFNFIPHQLLRLQPQALTGGSTNNNDVPHGVDAPWNVFTSFEVKKSDNKDSEETYKAKQIVATGGLRMGGSTYYSLDITDLKNPKLLYSVGSNYSEVEADKSSAVNGVKVVKGIKSTKKSTESSGDEAKAFARFGQSWGEPSVGYVKKNGKKVMVNFLPGGYDMGYESKSYKPTKTEPAQGNAVFMIKVGEEKQIGNDKTNTKIEFKDAGDLLWWASNTGSDIATGALKYNKDDNMIHSIVSEVKAIDRNYDGLTDHLYFADLGGQVWRVDINNNKDTENFKVDRVVKVLDVSGRATKGKGEQAPRFYEAPLITFDNIDYGQTQKSKIVAQISIASGNRSQPVTDQRTAKTSDALYSFIDKDMSRQDLFCYKSKEDINSEKCEGAKSSAEISKTLKTKDLTIEKLQELKFTEADEDIKTKMIGGKIEGWYFPFNSWVKNSTVTKDQSGIKALNQPDAIGGILYVPLYNPNAGEPINECDAGIRGASQIEQLCLPYGNCGMRKRASDAKKADFTKRYTKDIGVGIADSILAQVNPEDNSTGGAPSKTGIILPHCEGAECVPEKLVCVEGSTDPACENNPNFNSVLQDYVLNPLQWMERD